MRQKEYCGQNFTVFDYREKRISKRARIIESIEETKYTLQSKTQVTQKKKNYAVACYKARAKPTLAQTQLAP